MEKIEPSSVSRTHAAHSTAPRLSPMLRAALVIIILIGLAARVVLPTTTVFCRDQARACALAESIADGERPTAGLVNSGHFRNLPGYTYLLGAVWSLSPGPMSLVYFTISLNILAVIGSFVLIRRWFGPEVALWAGAFLSASPWAVHYSRWIWAQDLLFPAALLVYFFLFEWVCRQRRWASAGVVLSLALLVHIHLVGIVLALAVGLVILWCRPRLPARWLVIACALAMATLIPYVLDGHLSTPGSSRVGYRHFWRVVPGALMSVTGLGWRLEFRDGYAAFAAALTWRYWLYLTFMGTISIAFLVSALALVRGTWRRRKEPLVARRSPTAVLAALMVLIPLSFGLLGIRTSPSYLPVWYPLPFVVMALGIQRLLQSVTRMTVRRGLRVGALVLLIAQLAFFGEQLRYMRTRDGVPGSPLGQSLGAMIGEVNAAADHIDAAEVWLVYTGQSAIQDEATAYLLRHASWRSARAGRAVLRFGWNPGEQDSPTWSIRELPPGQDPPEEAFLVRPWSGPQQSGGKIRRVPARYSKAGLRATAPRAANSRARNSSA